MLLLPSHLLLPIFPTLSSAQGDLHRLAPREFFNDSLVPHTALTRDAHSCSHCGRLTPPSLSGCLSPSAYVQIEFYLLYLRDAVLPAELRPRVHVFNSFLFTLLTDRHSSSVAAAYQHVQRWTRGVNLFEKDFLILPINDPDRHHWSLAIVAHPGRQIDNAKAEQARKKRVTGDRGKRGGGRTLGRGSAAAGAERGREGVGAVGGAALQQTRIRSDGSLLSSSPSSKASSLLQGRLPALYRHKAAAPSPLPAAPVVPFPSPSSASRLRRSTASSASASASPPLTRQRLAVFSPPSVASASREQQTSRRMSQSKLLIQQGEEQQMKSTPLLPPPSATQLLARYGRERREQSSVFDAIQRQLHAAEEAAKLPDTHPRSFGEGDDSAAPAARSAPPLSASLLSTSSAAGKADTDDWQGEAEEELREVELRGGRRETKDGQEREVEVEPDAELFVDSGDEVRVDGDVGRYPIILHFDSLPYPKPQAAYIAKVLRQYLQCEWDHHLLAAAEGAGRTPSSSSFSSTSSSSPLPPSIAAAPARAPPSSSSSEGLSFAVPPLVSRVFDVRSFPHVEVKVPRQPNDFDCGPFILEYAHRFCMQPFPDTRPERVHRPHWFGEGDVHKRTEIRSLLQRLREEERQLDQAKQLSLSTRPPAPQPRPSSGAATQLRSPPRPPSTKAPSATTGPPTASAPRPSVAAAAAATRGRSLPQPSSASSSSSTISAVEVPDSDGEGAEREEEEQDKRSRGALGLSRRVTVPVPVSRGDSTQLIPSSLGEAELALSELDYEVD